MIQKIGPVNLKNKVYEALKKYILSLNIYLKETDFHLDERQLSEKLGVSRTPIREAVAKLEQEGIVKTVPRRGLFVHRKSKKELIDIVTVWAGLEGYAAHLIIQNSSKEEIEVLNKYCQSHEVDNLFVTDGSFMPTGGSVPYTFTIYANSFRVADYINENFNKIV